MPKPFNQYTAWRFAHAVGIGFEGQPPKRKTHSIEVFTKFGGDLLEQNLFLQVVCFLSRVDHTHFNAVMASGALQGLHIFWEAEAPAQ